MTHTIKKQRVPARNRPTMHDVAREAHVSIATVSKILSGTKGTIAISQVTRDRVLKASKKLHYIPNMHARALRRQSSAAIGLYFPTGWHPWISHVYSELTRYITIAMETEHRNLIIMIDPSHPETGKENVKDFPFPNIIAGKGIDGVICLHRASPSLLYDLKQIEMPYVLLNCHAEQEYNCVDCDDAVMVRESLEYLYHLGHRRIWFLGHTVDHPSYQIRRQAYEDFIHHKKLHLYPDLSRHEEPWVGLGNYGEWSLQQILSYPDPPTAILAYNDISALALLHAFRDRGIQVPRHVSLIGCDDIPETLVARPQITTVQFPANKMAETAARIILTQVQNDSKLQPSQLIRSRLVERDSCGPPPIDNHGIRG